MCGVSRSLRENPNCAPSRRRCLVSLCVALVSSGMGGFDQLKHCATTSFHLWLHAARPPPAVALCCAGPCRVCVRVCLFVCWMYGSSCSRHDAVLSVSPRAEHTRAEVATRVRAGPFCFMRAQDPAATNMASVDPSLLVRTLCVRVTWAWLIELPSAVPTRSTAAAVPVRGLYQAYVYGPLTLCGGVHHKSHNTRPQVQEVTHQAMFTQLLRRTTGSVLVLYHTRSSGSCPTCDAAHIELRDAASELRATGVEVPVLSVDCDSDTGAVLCAKQVRAANNKVSLTRSHATRTHGNDVQTSPLWRLSVASPHHTQLLPGRRFIFYAK